MRKHAAVMSVLCVTAFAFWGNVADVFAVRRLAITPAVYEVKFVKFELKKQDGTYVTIWSGSTTVDLAQLASGDFTALAALENLDVPAGTYTAFRASIDKTLSVACDDGNTQTDGGTLSAGGAGSVPTAVVSTGNPVAGDLVIPDAQLTDGVYLHEEAFAGPVTVDDGDAMGEFELTIDITETFIPVFVPGVNVDTYQPDGGDATPDITITFPAGF